MAFAAIMTRSILRSSREILERNLSLSGVTMMNGGCNIHVEHNQACLHPQRSITTLTAASLPVLLQKLQSQQSLMQQRQKSDITTGKRDYHEKTAKTSARRQDSDSESDSDSDDEYERKRKDRNQKNSQRGDSEFWRRKMRTLHRILDVNHDGVISFEDFNLLAKRFTDLGHLTPEVSAEFLEVMKTTWEEQFGELSPYNLVTAEQFLTDIHHRLNDKKMAKRIARFLPYLFKAVDYDHSGYLDLNQYKLFFRCLGLSDEDAAISFAVIDKNGDGQLSLKEFVHLGRQFFLTEDESNISKMFWGPLIDH